ncbi:MAG: decaprenyl-phosphate phosphoribosyltransferase [bacterium]
MNAWIRLLRPTSWVKNTLVFSALIFSGQWQNPSALLVGLEIFVIFSLIASSLYVLNDWRDRVRDRNHPRKKHRPIASGEIGGRGAVVGFVVLWLISFLMLTFIPSGTVLPVMVVLTSYVLLILAYNFGLKNVAPLDMLIVSVGLLLRALAGGVAIGVSITNWFMLAIFFIALLLVAGKRRRELIDLESAQMEAHRPVLGQYTERFLDSVISMMACASIITYSLYTLEGDTTRIAVRWALPFSVLFVVFGILRYLLLIYVEDGGSRPERIFVTDPPMIACIVAWVGYILCLFQGPSLLFF